MLTLYAIIILHDFTIIWQSYRKDKVYVVINNFSKQ